MKLNQGIAGLVFILLFVSLGAVGFFYLKNNPDKDEQVIQKIQTITSNNSEPSFISPLSLAHDQERKEGVKTIADQIFQYTSENKGLLPTDFPTTEICIGTSQPCYNLKSLLVPKFIDEIPIDPQTGTEENTGFTTFKNESGRVVVRIKGENGGEFEIVR